MADVTLTPVSVKQQHLRSERRARACALAVVALVALVLIVLVFTMGRHDTTLGDQRPAADTAEQVRDDGGP